MKKGRQSIWTSKKWRGKSELFWIHKENMFPKKVVVSPLCVLWKRPDKFWHRIKLNWKMYFAECKSLLMSLSSLSISVPEAKPPSEIPAQSAHQCETQVSYLCLNLASSIYMSVQYFPSVSQISVIMQRETDARQMAHVWNLFLYPHTHNLSFDLWAT